MGLRTALLCFAPCIAAEGETVCHLSRGELPTLGSDLVHVWVGQPEWSGMGCARSISSGISVWDVVRQVRLQSVMATSCVEYCSFEGRLGHCRRP